MLFPARWIIVETWRTLKIKRKKRIFFEKREKLQQSLMEAIEKGARFEEDDFLFFFERLRGIEWLGPFPYPSVYHDFDERCYKAAILSGNESACRSFEFWKERKPLMVEGQRIFVGRIFVWEGKEYRCSSFNEKRQFITICPVVRETRRDQSGIVHDLAHRRISWAKLLAEQAPQ